MQEEAELRVWNPSKEVSKEITLEILTRHRDAMKQARIGELPDTKMEELTDNTRKLNQVRALNLIISSQREMITISRPIIYFKSIQKWKKKNREPEEQEKNPFEKHDNDYNKMKEWLLFLKHCEVEILKAERTRSIEDDFILKKQSQDGDIMQLTNNFFDMLEDLEDSYEQIYLLMLTNKIVSAGIEEDEELTYKQKEEEAIRRVVEA